MPLECDDLWLEPLVLVADVSRPFKRCDNPNYIRQDGILYGWDETNCEFQQAWWMVPENPWPWLSDRVKREIGCP